MASRDRSADSSDPLAYFITWTTYGTWLPGDERGYVEWHQGWQLPNPDLQTSSRAAMSEQAVTLDQQQRTIVMNTVQKHCDVRGWKLWAQDCRTNHAHVVVTAIGYHPTDVRIQLKSWCTRHLKSTQPGDRHHWWAEGGSGRYLNTEEDLAGAIEYVLDAQNKPRP